MKKKLINLLTVLIVVLFTFSNFTPSPVTAKTVEPDPEVIIEQAVLDEMQTKGSASYWIQFKNDADLSLAYSMNWSDRGWFVYKTLLEQADETQALVQKYLLGSKVDYKSYWINNSILVTSSSSTVLNDIIKFDGVESIQARKTYILYEPDTSASVLDNGVNAIEPNLTHVNADDVWALGIDGAGLVIANIDTGVRYSHQALVEAYRGNDGGTFDHNYNWFNPDDLTDDVPRDGHGHGTHTMGTMVGDDGGSNQIGIAPGAEWMACAGCPDGGCTDSALLGCGQFIAAPTDLTGNNANPDLRPNAVNNSWGDCGQTYDSWFAGVIGAWHAVGTYPIFSNGNASNCGYSSPPGLNTVGNPARSGNVTGVGSSGEQNGQYASHSNWGPTDDPDTVNPVAPFEDLKPQVIAPGVSIRSSVPTSDTSYEDGWSGTSMSAPHVTGLVALIWQAAPCLIGDYATTETIIESTAVDLIYDDGSADTPTNFPNYATGWGEIDALAAVNMASGMCAMGTLEGTVTDGSDPVEDAKIFADNGAGYTKNIYTDGDGFYSTGLPDGTYTLTASKYGYQSETVTGIVITEGLTTNQDFVIPQLGMSIVSGNVYDGGVVGLGSHGYPLYSSIHVSTAGFDETIFADPFTGYYEIELVEETEHTFTTDPIPGGYNPLVESVTAMGTEYTHDIYVPVDGAVCAAPGYQPDYDIFYSFEDCDEGFTAGGTTSFAWGDFTSGPMAGHSGTKGIATNPGGTYNASELGWMASPVLDMSGYGTSSIAIQWWDWKDIESATYDWARLDVTKDGGVTWTPVWGPVGGVTDTAYNQQTVTLDPTYNVSNFQFRFYFKSDSSVEYDGWYIDDIGIVGVPVPPPTTVFSTNFDADNGGFVASGTNSTWAWGAPTSGPGAPYSPPNVWATNLAGNYNNSEESYITSPTLDLSAHVGMAPTISFMHWYNSESNSYDWGSVEATKDGGATWDVIWQKFGTLVDPWTPKSLPLDPAYAVSNFQFRFHFHSDSSVNSYAGWYIDDVAVTVAEPVEIAAPCVVIPGGVVAGYVMDDNDDSPIVGADVYSDVVATQTFFIPEDPASEGLFWVFHPVMGPPPINIQSLSGSNITFDPTAGGAEGYEPGVPTTLCFESNIYSPDWEYVYDTWLKFPTDWTISNTYLVGTPTCDVGFWPNPPQFFWETQPYEIDIDHLAATTNGGDHCVAEYCVDVTPGPSAGLVSWYYDGDGYAAEPHHPCSSDVYTPASMVGNECDEWINPQASIPVIGGEAHDFTAEKDFYGSDTETVTVFDDFIVQQDFYLGTGELVFEPDSLEATMFMGDAPYTETLTISNLGTSDASFELVEKDEGFVLPHLMIPAFKGELPQDTRPVSIGRAPDAANISAFESVEDNPFAGILSGEPAFAIDLTTDTLKYIPDTTLPGTWTDVGSTMTSLFAGDFLAGDFTTLYAISYDNNNLYTVDVATGAYTLVGASTPPGGQSWTGLSGTPDGTLYGLTTDISASTLVTVDPGTGAVTVLGDLPGLAGGIDLAYNTDDDMIYIVDLITDSLFKVDPTTLAVTLVGSTGVSANYAQGMDYEEESDVLYWAAYTTTGELRILDTTTGASTLVGGFPGGVEVDALAFPTGGQSDVPWLSEDPVSGVVTPTTPVDVTITFDPTGAGLSQPGDYLAALKVKHETPYVYPNIPIVLHLFAPGTFGTFNGHVLGMEACDINPAALEGATVNFWQDSMIKYTTTTNSEGYYSYAVPEGTYDIEVLAAGYLSQLVIGQVVTGGGTVTVDLTLRLDAPCISVDPTNLEQTQVTNTTSTQTLTVTNTGAGEGVFELLEMPVAGLNADVELILDDGTRENGVGIGGTLEFIWVNRFTPNPDSFPFNLDQIQLYFTADDMVTVGDEIRLVVYENVTGNEDPAVGSNFLYSYDTTVQTLGTWNNFDLPEPVELNGPGDVIVGVIGLEVPGTSYWPAALDETASQGRSWAGWWTASPPPTPPTLPPTEDWTLIDAYFPGNWMVRGMGSSAAGDILWLSLDPTAGVVPGDDSVNVTVTYDSAGLAMGDYFGSIRVKNPPAAAINVPVTLHVTELNYLYLPLILK